MFFGRRYHLELQIETRRFRVEEVFYVEGEKKKENTLTRVKKESLLGEFCDSNGGEQRNN